MSKFEGVIPEPKSDKQLLMLTSEATITVIGGAAGSGKSYIMTAHPLQYIDDPKYRGIFFRRNTTQLRGAGGLYETATEMYGELPLNLRPRFREKDMLAKFPSGATIKWNHLEHVKSREEHQGLQYTGIYFDEGTHFDWLQVEYLMSRMRSPSRKSSYMVISCNPDPDCTWLMRMVEWYLDEEGYPDPEKDGVIRWFIRRGDTFHWAETKQEAYEKYGRKDEDGNLLPEDHKFQIRPVSFTFISATIYDNPVMLETNPDYLAMLEALSRVEKARLLHGNWYARPEGANYFQRGWLKELDSVPESDMAEWCRAWDKASTLPNETNRYPDFTASVKMGKTYNGEYIIVGDYHRSAEDPTDRTIKGKFRTTPGERDRLILRQAEFDGTDTVVVFPVDPSSAGKVEYQESVKPLVGKSFTVRPDPAPNNKSKLTRFTPFSSAAEAGLVSIVKSTFPNVETYELFLAELEAFNGERSSSSRKDDWPDAAASAFNYLAQSISIRPFSFAMTGGVSKIKQSGMFNGRR